MAWKEKTKDFENFLSNEPFGNFATNCNKLANEIDLDPFGKKEIKLQFKLGLENWDWS